MRRTPRAPPRSRHDLPHERLHVVDRDAAARPGALHLSNLDAQLARHAPHGRRGRRRRPVGLRAAAARSRPWAAADVDDLAAFLARATLPSPHARRLPGRAGQWPRAACFLVFFRLQLVLVRRSRWRPSTSVRSEDALRPAAALFRLLLRAAPSAPAAAAVGAAAFPFGILVDNRMACPTFTFSPALTLTSLTMPATRRGHFDGGFVGLELENRLVFRDRVAGLDQNRERRRRR